MQNKFFISFSGQEVEVSDINLVGLDAALADDLVFAELFRMTPYNGTTATKGILPYGPAGAIVEPNGATGSAKVFPCRAFISSNTAVATNANLNWNDIRTTVVVGSTTLSQQVNFTANSSGNPRWDLVYLAVSRDANGPSVTRYIKTAGPPVAETPTPLSVTQNTTATVGVVTGTPAAGPLFPATPTDGGGIYYVPLAYVLILDGFNSTTTLNTVDICDAAPVIVFSETTGGVTIRPASTQSSTTGAMMTTTLASVGVQTAIQWGVSEIRPPLFMPPSMSGEEVLYIALDLKDASNPANWSQPDGSVLDGTRDWRNRIFNWFCQVAETESSVYPNADFSWVPTATATNGMIPNAQISNLIASPDFGWDINNAFSNLTIGMGQSFSVNPSSASYSTVAWLINQPHMSGPSNAGIAATSEVRIYVDTSTGQLKFTTNSTFPQCKLIMRLAASSPFQNR